MERQLAVRWIAPIMLGWLVGCSGRGECPNRVVPNGSCRGADLQCPYDVPVLVCGVQTQTIPSSCSCTNGAWVCPAADTAACPSTSTTTDSPSTSTSTNNGSSDSSGQSSSDAGTWYSTTADASTSSGSGSTGATSAPVVVVKTDASSRATTIKPSSCPLVMVWNGAEFQYETDVGGYTINLPADTPSAQAVRVPNGGMFFHKLPHAVFDPQNGMVIRFRESVGEITYVDELRLILVDHPAGYEIWSSGDESTNEWGYVEPFKVYTTKEPRAPISAVDRTGRDVLASLRAADNNPGPLDPELLDNDYTVDFGPIEHPENAKLLIDGWSIYLVRAPENIQPYVEAEDQNGTWVFVKRFGAPYGDLKTVVVDLANALPAGARRLRVRLGLEMGARWVIDRIRLDDSAQVPVTLTSIDPTTAELVHRGRATVNRPSFRSRQDALDDENVDDPLQQGWGAFTRYGDVLDLLKQTDDEYVIMRHGDQITLGFPGVAAPADGLVGTVVLQVNDTMKTFYFDSGVEPLPFQGMTSYPYPSTEAYPSDPVHDAFRATYNTRFYPAPPR